MYKNDKVIRRYSESFKLKILDELTTRKLNKSQLGKLYGINPTTINEWIRKYNRKDLMNTSVATCFSSSFFCFSSKRTFCLSSNSFCSGDLGKVDRDLLSQSKLPVFSQPSTYSTIPLDTIVTLSRIYSCRYPRSTWRTTFTLMNNRNIAEYA